MGKFLKIFPLRHFVEHLLCTSHFPRPSSFSRTLSSFSTNPPPLNALLNQDPIEICSNLWVKSFSSPPTTTFPNLTGFLSKFDLWLLAYQRSCGHVTGTFPPRNAVHSHVLHDLLSLRNAVVKGNYSWNNKTHQLIRSPNDNNKPTTRPVSKRKLREMLDSDEPCFQDRVVQEVLLMIIEPFFEARFSAKAHGFRPGRNAHTVIRTIRSNFAGYLWFLKGDISEVLDNVDRNVVMGCLEQVVKDMKILGLVKSALRAPNRVLIPSNKGEEWPRNKKKNKVSKKKKILNEREAKPGPLLA